MTKTEFNSQIFVAGDKAKYKGDIYHIISVDFEDYLIGLRMNITSDFTKDIILVSCEDVKYLGK